MIITVRINKLNKSPFIFCVNKMVARLDPPIVRYYVSMDANKWVRQAGDNRLFGPAISSKKLYQNANFKYAIG